MFHQGFQTPNVPRKTQDKWAVDVFRNVQAAREKKFLYSSRGVCQEIMMFTVYKLLKGWKIWTAFP